MLSVGKRLEGGLTLVVGVLALATLGTATRIDSVCKPFVNSTGTTRPKLPDTFRVNVECAMHEQNRTIFVREYYDYNGNRGRIHQLDALTNSDAYYDYNDNQIIMVDNVDSYCLVQRLGTSDDRFMFGYKTGKEGQPHIFGASGALHFGDTPEHYLGKTQVRGITVNAWNSCQYSDALNATMNVTWYFSAKDEWDMQLGDRSVPIRATAVGEQYYFGHRRPFNHTYDLYRFEPYIYPDGFEIPEGVVCKGMEQSKPFPTIPDRFAFIVEDFNFDQQGVTYIEESYDRQSKINVYRYKTKEDASALAGVNRMTQVNDFNTGVSYIVDTAQSSCQVVDIGDSGYSFIQNLGHGQVVMDTPAEFFEEGHVKYTYAGVRTSREIPCEVWVTKSDRIQGFTDQNLTLEWYFALSSDQERWTDYGSNTRLPVRFRLWKKGETDSIEDFNVYYFDVGPPRLLSVDLTPCYYGTQSRRFTFDIDGSAHDDVFNNLAMFKYALTTAVSLYAGVSQLRVADIQVYYGVDVIHISFDILDKPAIAGDVGNINQENNLTLAADSYTRNMASGKVQLFVDVGTSVKTIKPLVGSAAEIQQGSSDNSFTPGALAGLGVGMLLLGSTGGAGAAFFFFK